MTRGRDEIETTMNTIVDDVRLANNAGFSIEILFIFGVDLIDDRLPTKRTIALSRCLFSLSEQGKCRVCTDPVVISELGHSFWQGDRTNRRLLH